MRDDPVLVIERLYSAWRRQCVDGVLALCSADIQYVLHLPGELSRFAGTLDGKAATAEYLRAVCDAWEFLELEAGPMVCEGGLVREMTWFRARHRASGEIMESRKRHIWHVEFGQVTACQEYQDTPMMRAFMGLKMMSANAIGHKAGH